MASENILSREIVEVSTRGVQQAEAELDRTRKATDKIGGAASQAQAFVGRLASSMATAFRAPSAILGSVAAGLRRAKEMMEGVASLAARIAAGGGLGIGGIIVGASRGTVEGERFSQALERLTRIVGESFAPYVRMATEGLKELGNWFRGLSESTRDSIAQWALITAGVAAFATFLPVIVGGVASVAAILATLVSPAALVVGALAAVTVAAARMFGFFQTGSADAADAMNQSNDTWLGALIKGVGAAVSAMARMFNWILQQGAKVSDWLAIQMAKAAEFLNLAPKGTAKMAASMPPIQAPQIDVGAVENFFGKVARGAGAAVVGFDDLIKQLKDAGGLFDRLKQKANFGQGFRLKMDVGFESLQGTFERLQKTLGSQSGMAVEQAQLGQLQQINEGMQKAAGGIAKIGDLVPAVR